MSMSSMKSNAHYDKEWVSQKKTQNILTAMLRDEDNKKFLATECVPTKVTDVPLGWKEAGSKELKNVQFKKLHLPGLGGPTPRVESETTKTVIPAAFTVSLPLTTNKTTTSLAFSNVTDLLVLSLGPTSPSLPPLQPPPPTTSSSADLLGLNSAEFSAFVEVAEFAATDVREKQKILEQAKQKNLGDFLIVAKPRQGQLKKEKKRKSASDSTMA